MKSHKAKVLHRAGARPWWSTRWIGRSRSLRRSAFSWWWAIRPSGFAPRFRRPDRIHRADRTARHRPRAAGGRDALSHLDGNLVIFYGDGPLLRAATVRRLIEPWMRAMPRAHCFRPTCPTHRLRACGSRHKRRGDDHRGAERRHCRATGNSRSQHGHLLLSRGTVLAAAVEMRPDNPAHEYYLTDMVQILNRAGHHVRAMKIDDRANAWGSTTGSSWRKRTAAARAQAARADAGRRDHREAGDGDIDGGVEIASIPWSSRLRASWATRPSRKLPHWGVEHHRGFDPRRRSGDWSTDGVTASRLSVARKRPFSRLRPGITSRRRARRQFRGVEKDAAGRGRQGQSPGLPGRCGDWRKANIAPHDHLQLRWRAQAPTRIGDGAFVGSNSTLVAPLEIGDGAYLAAGSVITSSSADSLAVGRAAK